MSPWLKNLFLIFSKNAVNAVLASGLLKIFITGSFNFNSPNDWWNFGKSMASVIIAREVMVWGPILFKWSDTSSNPAAILLPDGGIEVPPKKDRQLQQEEKGKRIEIPK
jgi:hypothetical protein